MDSSPSYILHLRRVELCDKIWGDYFSGWGIKYNKHFLVLIPQGPVTTEDIRKSNDFI